jgi:nucleoside-diphosphate-sugar epimerase
VVHLAAMSNDPLGNLNPECTYDVNHLGTMALAQAARKAGVSRFIQSSSCSLYGAGGDDFLTESSSFSPVTAYGESKARVEKDLVKLADKNFSPIFLRNGTAYGSSPKLRADLVINNLVGYAYTTGEVLIKSDGTPWRPLVHVEDISAAFLAALEAPREVIHNRAFHVGLTEENYRVRELADMVKAEIPSARITYAEGSGPDPRCYRVDCGLIKKAIPGFRPRWRVREGIAELHEAYKRNKLTKEEFLGSRYLRIKHIMELQAAGKLDSQLRWKR